MSPAPFANEPHLRQGMMGNLRQIVENRRWPSSGVAPNRSTRPGEFQANYATLAVRALLALRYKEGALKSTHTT